MAISETITIDAGPAVAELREVASAAKSMAAEVKSAFADIKVPSLSGSGAGKMASGFEGAAEKISAAVTKIETSLGRLDGLGASAAGSLGSIGKAAGDGAAGLAAFADAEKSAADAAARLGKSGVTASDGVKSTGTSAKESSGWLDEYNATMKATADMQRDLAATSVDSSLAMARGQKLHAEASAALASSSIENDARMRQSALATKAVQEDSAAAAASGARKHEMLLLGIAGAAAYGIDKAAKLQTQVTRLYTSAGESQKNLPMMTQGILGMSGATATSQSELGRGAYMIESAGFHGKAALSILKAAAQGAQAEGAPLGEVGNALTSLMISYGMKPGQATSAMNQIITMVGSGKMTMQGAVGALPNLLPVASKAGLSFGQAGGALATMTQTGMSPDQAAQNLAHTIGSVQNPNHVQTLEMQQLGIDSVKLSKNLGKEGLTGAISQVEGAILHNMGPAGTVLLKSFNQSKLAAQSAVQEIAAMPAPLQRVARAYLDGSIGSKAWGAELQGLPGIQATALKQFAATADAAHGFNSQLKAGGGDAQTFAAALSKAMGGTVGMRTALMLGGDHMPVFKANADAIAASAQHAGENVKGWADIQKTFNFQLHAFQYSAEAAATTVGTALLPAATGAMHALAGAGSFLADHPALAKGLAAGAGLLGGAYALQRVSKPVTTALQGVGKVAQVLHIPGLDKLAGVGSSSGLSGAATSLAGAGGSLKGAAAELSGAAAEMRGAGVAGGAGGAARKAEGAAAGAGAGAAEGEAAAAGASRFKTPAMTAGVGALAALTIVDPVLRSMSSGPGGKNWFENPFGMAGPHDKGSSGNWLTSFSPYERLFNQAKAPAPPPAIPAGTAPATAARFGVGPSAPAKVTVDTSGVDSAKGKVQSAVGGIDQILHGFHPAKIPAPDTSALDAAKGKAKAAGDGITQAIEQAIHKPVKANPPDLSAYSSAAGKAQADGAAISSGLASGIRGGEGAAVAAAQQVAAAVTSALNVSLQVHSPSRVTYKTGTEFSAGLAHGIRHSVSQAKAAAAGLSASAVLSLTQGLQGGKSAIDAALQAITGKGSRPQDITTIDTAVQKLLAQAPKGDTALTAMLRADNKALDNMARNRAKLEQEIAGAEQVAKSVIGNASITGALNAVNPAGNEPVSSTAVVTGQGYQASTMKQFAQSLMQLQKEGLNATALSQLAQSDPATTLPLAQGIASGGKDAIRQLNQLQKSMQSSAAQIGDIAGPSMVQAGKDMSAGLAVGLKSELGSLDKAMEMLAKSMVASVHKHTAAAKKATAKAGAGTAAAAASGTTAGASQAASDASSKSGLSSAASALSGAAAALSGAAGALTGAASALKGDGAGKAGTSHPVMHPVTAGGAGGRIAGASRAGSPAGFGGYGGLGGHGGGGVTVNHTTHVTVQGSVTTHQDLATSLADIYQTRATNNWQSPLRTPGRAN